jgi:type IX secretion system PorP/SprF family membrane protein
MIKKLLLILSFLFLDYLSNAQDHIYSQFYNAPQYLNPALNGQFNGDFRLNAIYRNQWSNIAGPLTYFTFATDISVPEFGGGFGVIVTKSSEGTAYLNKTNFSGIYSYSVDFGNTGNLSFGIQGGITNRKIDQNKLIYFDQLNNDGIIFDGISSASPLEFNNKFFFDSGVGINLIVGNLMFGAAGNHLNKPNESFTGTSSPLPMRINGYASYKFILDYYDDEDSPSLTPSVLYYSQAELKSISLGFQVKNKSVNIGLWYRGDNKQRDAVVFSIILDLFNKQDYYDKVRLGFSHDATSSRLGYGNTAGTTEGSLIYETTLSRFSNNRGSRFNNNSRKCYDFY